MVYRYMSWVLLLSIGIGTIACNSSEGKKGSYNGNTIKKSDTVISASEDDIVGKEVLDTALFNKLQLHLVHNKPDKKWPVKSAYPLPGALLPFNRIVAYYGNFYSRGMGVLGEQPIDTMLQQLKDEVQVWQEADPEIPVIPAIHYIAVTAQRKPGVGNKYRLRMPFNQIDKALRLSKQINGILILDIQVGHSTLQEELPALASYLRMPDVHLAIDPEYSMKGGQVPCSTLGTFDAADINYASGYLAQLVKEYHLPPKVLVIHRFTNDMVTNYKSIITRPEVQIVIDMDGFGFPAKKINSYKIAVTSDPVQFAGFKIFYKNDQRYPPHKLMTPPEILKLYPSPIYIQYQ